MSESRLFIDANEGDRLVRDWSLTDVVLITFAILILFLMAAVGFRFAYEADNISDTSILVSTLLAVLEGIVLIGSVYLVGLRRKGWNWSVIGFVRPSGYWMFVSIIIGVLGIPISAMIAVGVQLILGRPIENTQLTFLAPDGFTWFGAISMVILGGLVAPFAEELYFRGVLYRWIKTKWAIWPSILLSSLVFGLVHGEPSVAAAAFVLGIFIAWVYDRSSSLWTAFIVHAINNSAKILLLYLFLGLGYYV